MKKLCALLALFSIVVAGGAAQTDDTPADPGLITPDSPLYGVETAAENTLLDLGLRDPGELAYERASELRYAVERNRTDAVENAQTELNSVAQAATSVDTDGLAKAQAVLEAVQDQTPEASQDGLDTALSSVQDAMDRVPDVADEANNRTDEDAGGLPDGLPI